MKPSNVTVEKFYTDHAGPLGLNLLTGGNSLHSIEDIWKAMSAVVPVFAGLSWAKIGDHGIQLSSSVPSNVPAKP